LISEPLTELVDRRLEKKKDVPVLLTESLRLDTKHSIWATFSQQEKMKSEHGLSESDGRHLKLPELSTQILRKDLSALKFSSTQT